MDRCSEFQTQLLDFVYDLLDPDVSEQLRAHLDVCSPCQSALLQAEGQQELLAAAARLEFPAVQFAPPAPQTEAVPAVISMPAMPRRNAAWRRWLAAASILAALAIPSALGLDYADARRDLAPQKDAIARLDREQEVLNQKAAKLIQQGQEKFARKQEEVLTGHHNLIASGPPTAQAGSINEYKFEWRDGKNQPVRGKLDEVKIIDRARGDKVVFVTKDVAINGMSRITLPQHLDTAPDSRLMLQVRASTKDGAESFLDEDFLLTPATYLTHLATDKPMYQPGETVRFRSLSLERFSLQPAAERLSVRYTIATPQGGAFEIPQGDFNALFREGPGQGAAVVAPTNKMLHGIGGGEWDIPAALEGGEYLLTVSEDNNRFPAQQRKFVINRFQKPRLLKELVFNKRSYGPGDDVQAECTVKVGKDPVVRCKAEASVQIDGKTYDADGNESGNPFALETDAEGKAVVRFKLPKQIERGQASVNVNFLDGGKPEALLKPIPIVVKKLDVEFYPEGGYLVPHVPCRVYFQARTTLGKPAELKGRLMDDTGDVVALTETLADDKEPGVNQGMGVFRFTPRPHHKYHLELDRPAGVTAHYPLKPEPWGTVGLSIPQAVTMSHEPVEVELRSFAKTRQLLVGAYCRGRMFDHVRVTAPAGQDVKVTLNPAQGVGGVYRVTVFEEMPAAGQRPHLTPVAERLIFRQQRDRLNLDVALARKPETTVASAKGAEMGESRRYAIPGERLGVTVSARDENQQLTPAVVMIGVVDQSVLKLADEKTARSMPTHFFLTSEVRKPEELEFADFLLTTHPKASLSLDLLLGTQGWRRFAEQKLGEAREKMAEQTQAMAVLMNPVEVPRVTSALGRNEEKRSLADKLKAETDKINAELAADRAQLEARHSALKKEREEARTAPAYRAAEKRIETYVSWLAYWPVFFLFLVGTCIVLACRGLAEPMRKALPYFTGAAACAVPAVLVAVLAFSTRVERERSGQELRAAGKLSEKEWEPMVAPDDGNVLGSDWPGDPIEEKRPTPKTDPAVEAAGEFGTGQGGFGAKPQDQPAATMAAPGLGGPRAPMPGGGFNQARGKAGAGGMAGDVKAGAIRKENQADAVMEPFDGKRKAGWLDKGKETGKYDERENEKKDREPAMDDAFKQQFAYRAKRLRQFDRTEGKEGKKDDPAFFFIREYAHMPTDKGDLGVRNDMTDTVYWHPALVLADGKADVWFTLNDAVTAYQVTVYGHTTDGRVAAAKPFVFEARLPLALDSATPLQVTMSDKIIVPVTVANNSDQDRDVTLRLKTFGGLKNLKEEPKTSATIDPKKPSADSNLFSIKRRSTGRRLYEFSPLSQGPVRFEVEGFAKPYSDRFQRDIDVVAEGFPIAGSVSDLLEGGQAKHEINLPSTWIRGTLQMRLQAFPSTLADLQSGLEGLLREPYGCFEQASTANYPNVLILSYLKEANQAKPEMERRVRELMESGYQKLTSYECQQPNGSKREGYEWFGGTAPPHEALTAYGLLQFRDMARHHEVDRTMLERTRKYLLSRRDGKGGFERNSRASGDFGRAPDHVTDAYIVWSLTESGPGEDLKRETEALIEKAKASKDPYFLALVANGLINQAKSAQALPLLKKVAEAQKTEGFVDGAETSITGSGGRDLQIETTALALLAWLKADPGQFAAPIDKAAKWIGQQRGGHGAFGSTQSTILALKALIAYAKQTKRPREGGELKLFVNGQFCGEQSFKATASETLAVSALNVEDHLKPGKNTVRIVVTGKNQFPYSLGWTYQTLTPPSDAGCTVKLAASLSKTKAAEGDSVRMTVKVENAGAQGQGMAVAIVGLPGGLSLPEDFKQLLSYKELPKDGSRPLISAFEVRGRELILYWRDLAPNQKIEVPVDLSCRVPGDYSGPASRAYLYYNSDHKTWAEPLRISIAPRGE